MKNAIILLLSLLFVYSCSSDSSVVTDLKRENLKGEVQKTIYNKYYVQGSPQYYEKASLDSRSEYIFNKYGNIVEETIYDIHNNIVEKSILTYNDKNQITRKSTNDIKNQREINLIYHYNSEGLNEKVEINVPPAEVNNYIMLEYDNKGNKIKEIYHRGSDHSDYLINEYKYGEKYLLPVYRSTYNISTGVRNNYILAYDSKGNLISTNNTTPDGKSVMNLLHQYNKFDSNGNWTEKLDFNGNSQEQFPVLITEREIVYY